MKRRNLALLVLGALVVLVVVGAWAYFRPQIRFSVKRELVGPEDEAMSLLLSGASLQEIKDAVERSGKNVDEIRNYGCSLLFWAVSKNREDVAKWLLAEGANPNGVSQSASPLENAICRQNLTMVRLLLANGADPDADTGGGLTPRKIAEREGNPEILSALPPKKE
ncbi:MAG: ankyrin repeat domain-containing protein [Phycisphaerae bacterium]